MNPSNIKESGPKINDVSLQGSGQDRWESNQASPNSCNLPFPVFISGFICGEVAIQSIDQRLKIKDLESDIIYLLL
jgi:hypothetical protein